MGEIADWLIDQFLDEDEYDPRPAPTVTCNRCGKRGLYWTETPNGWRLSQNREAFHVCTPDVTDLFNVIEEEK
jgi:hypothetical protein